MRVYDEITGLYMEQATDDDSPLFLIVDECRGMAYACATTMAEAMRRQLELGLRARTTIIRS